MTFANFLVGRSNQLAHAAAQRVATHQPGQPLLYNPLYIHAPVGLDLGGRSAPEIALSVMAEVVAARHGVPLGAPRPQAPPDQAGRIGVRMDVA